jgi:HK97 family phage portal protein
MMGFRNFVKRITGLVDINDLGELFKGYDSTSGEFVSADTVKRLFAVYACVNVLAETLATLPLKLYRTDSDDNRVSAKETALAKTIKNPNPTDTSFDFFERIVWHLALRGKFFAIKIKVFGEVVSLLPVANPDSVGVSETSDHRYEFTIGGKTYSQDDVFFIIMHDGKSVIKYQADTFGKNQAINKYGASFFKNGARPTTVIETTSNFKDENAYQRFRQMWEDTYGGAGKAHKTGILNPGMTLKTLDLTNEDSQFLETNKYSDSQIAGLFRVPVYMIGNYDKATFSNIENLGQQFSRFTMAPWCRRIETAITRQCIYEKDVYSEFLMDSLERGNLLTRYQAYNVGRTAGFLSANEIRRKENMNPYDGGDEYWFPLNTTTAGKGEEK